MYLDQTLSIRDANLKRLMMAAAPEHLKNILSQRIVLLDGAYGTLLQGHNLEEDDYRGVVLKDHQAPLKGNYDVLCLSQPEIVVDAHRQ